MSAKDEALAKITSALSALDDAPRSREVSLARTKLQEGAAWLAAATIPRPIEFARSGDVLTAALPLGDLRVELMGDGEAACSMRIHASTPIDFSVTKPHDRPLESEATEVLAGLYWSRERAILSGAGRVTIAPVG